MKLLTLFFSFVVFTSQVFAQGADPAKPTIFKAGDIIYKTQSTPFGELGVANIFGDPSKAGPYAQRIKFPPNMGVAPHAHGKNELKIVSLIEGELLFGYLGDEGEVMTPGNIWTESMGLVHFGKAGPEGAIIEIHGVGPVQSIPYQGN